VIILHIIGICGQIKQRTKLVLTRTMTRKILLTGATGFLGSHLSKRLIEDGNAVLAIKRPSSSTIRLGAFASEIQWLNSEKLNIDSLGRIDAVIHTATCYGRKQETAEELLFVNTIFPLRLLELAVRNDVGVFMNSDTSLPPLLNSYSLSKKQFLMWGKLFAASHSLSFVNLRLEQFYGAFDDPSKFTSYVIKGCLNHTSELQFTDGVQQRDFIHIDDVVNAYMRLLSTNEPSFSEFDVGSGHSISIRSFAETVKRVCKSSTQLNFGSKPYRNREIMHTKADISKLKALGWSCLHDLESGLLQVIEKESI
jgi:CDP-paratose synthetase